MATPRTETDPRPAPAQPPRRLPLSPAQVAASALAAVSSAVVASFLGVAGTVIGAALASVVSTVSAALYSASLRRTIAYTCPSAFAMGHSASKSGGTRVSAAAASVERW